MINFKQSKRPTTNFVQVFLSTFSTCLTSLVFHLESASSLEAIKQSYINTVNELNQELLAMKEAYDQLDTEKQALVDELEKRSVEIDQNEVKRITGMLSILDVHALYFVF